MDAPGKYSFFCAYMNKERALLAILTNLKAAYFIIRAWNEVENIKNSHEMKEDKKMLHLQKDKFGLF
jgi:hypothetical protein